MSVVSVGRLAVQSFCPSWSPELAKMVVETAAKPPGKAVKPGSGAPGLQQSPRLFFCLGSG